jgi:hypothetical protein
MKPNRSHTGVIKTPRNPRQEPVESTFVERTPVELIVFAIQTNARRLQRIGHDKVMPYYVQELLEYTIQVLDGILNGDPSNLKSLRDIVDEIIAKHADFVKRGVCKTTLPAEYADILEDVGEFMLYVTYPNVGNLDKKRFLAELTEVKRQLDARV